MTFGKIGARKMMHAAWINPYVKDGLIAMWDGEWNAGPGEHDATATTWKDLVGSTDFSLTDAGSWSADSLLCTGTRAAATATRISSYVTAEAVFLNRSSSGMVFAAFSRGKAFVSYDTEMYLSTYYKSGSFSNSRNLRQAVCAIYADSSGTAVPQSFFHNGLVGTVVGGALDYNITDGIMLVGGQSEAGDTRALSGEVCALRLYSRALTADEVAANYDVDKRRFSIA